MTTTTQMTGESAVRSLLAWCGYDVEADGLADTPRRVATAWAEMTSGEHIDPSGFLATIFHPDRSTDEMIVLRRVPFSSLCEHHVLPFVGHVTVAYVPTEGAGIVGVSKLARVIEAYSRRLQVQERFTTQVADCIEDNLDTRGVAVTVTAIHTCMSLRGIRKDSAEMVTSVTRGLFREDARARAEFFALAR